MGDDLVEERAHALVFLPVVGSDRAEVELHVLDRHFRHVGDEDATQGVRVRRLRLLEEEPHRLRVRSEDLELHLTPPPATPTLGLRPIVWDRRDLFDPADPQARAGQGPDRRLRTRTGRLRSVPSGGPHADVDRVDPLLFRGISHPLGGFHRRIGRSLVLRGFHDHPARRLRDRLGSRDIGQCDDDVVVRRIDVRDSPAGHGHSSFGAGPGPGAAGSSPERSGPSSAPAPSAAAGGPVCPCWRTGWRSFAISDRSSYAMPFSCVRVTSIPGIVTRRPPTETWPCTMNCLACRGVKASPFRNVKVCSRRERMASTSRASTSSRVVPSRGRSPTRPSRWRSCSRSFSACLSPVRTRAWSSRARWRNLRRMYWDRHSSFLFFRPYFFNSSFSALIRSASHGWEGRSYFARENFGSPIHSRLGRFLLFFFLLFLLLFLLPAGFLRLLRLGGGEGGLLRHTDGQARPAVGPRALSAHLLSGLMPDALVRADHLHAVDVIAPTQVDLRADRVQVQACLPVVRPIDHPGWKRLTELPEGRLDLVRLFLGQVPEAFRAGHLGEVRDGLGDADADARDGGEGVRDRSRTVEVRVRHPDDVSEVLFHAFEFLRRSGRFGLVLRLFLLLGRALASLPLRGGRRRFRFRARLILSHL